MLSKKDAQHYRKIVKRRRFAQRVKGVALLALSFTLMLYAIPAFATSVWDYDDPAQLDTMFSSGVTDNSADMAATDTAADNAVLAEGADAAEEVPDAGYAYTDIAASGAVGPALAQNDSAVQAAKTRAKAMAAVTENNSKMVYGKKSEPVVEPMDTSDLVFAFVALGFSILFAFLGIKTIMQDRIIRGKRISDAYSQALRAS